jgi:hypothetical protein
LASNTPALLPRAIVPLVVNLTELRQLSTLDLACLSFSSFYLYSDELSLSLSRQTMDLGLRLHFAARARDAVDMILACQPHLDMGSILMPNTASGSVIEGNLYRHTRPAFGD